MLAQDEEDNYDTTLKNVPIWQGEEVIDDEISIVNKYCWQNFCLNRQYMQPYVILQDCGICMSDWIQSTSDFSVIKREPYHPRIKIFKNESEWDAFEFARPDDMSRPEYYTKTIKEKRNAIKAKLRRRQDVLNKTIRKDATECIFWMSYKQSKFLSHDIQRKIFSYLTK